VKPKAMGASTQQRLKDVDSINEEDDKTTLGN
jgi:hypothetical protein